MYRSLSPVHFRRHVSVEAGRYRYSHRYSLMPAARRENSKNELTERVLPIHNISWKLRSTTGVQDRY